MFVGSEDMQGLVTELNNLALLPAVKYLINIQIVMIYPVFTG